MHTLPFCIHLSARHCNLVSCLNCMSRKCQISGCAVIATAVFPVAVCNHFRRIVSRASEYKQDVDVSEIMSTMFLEASEKAMETPGQATPVVRAYVSLALQELTSSDLSSSGTTESTYQVKDVYVS